MSTAEYTITLHNTDNSARRLSIGESAQPTQNAQRELFRTFAEKYIIGIVIAFTMIITLIYSVFAATRTEYLPSAIILIITLWIISVLLERSKDNG